jgi:hypothetical protein
MRWMDGVEDLSSKRVVRHRDGGTTLWREMVCEVITEASLRRKCFKQYKVGDILVNRKKVANIHEDYKVSVVKRPPRVRSNWIEPFMFEIKGMDSVDLTS